MAYKRKAAPKPSGRRPQGKETTVQCSFSCLPQLADDMRTIAGWDGDRGSFSSIVALACQYLADRHRCSRCHAIAQVPQRLGDSSSYQYCPACWALGEAVLIGWEWEQRVKEELL